MRPELRVAAREVDEEAEGCVAGRVEAACPVQTLEGNEVRMKHELSKNS